ncbi:helicase-related protein [Candidatus Poriferisocius sp.]|uniref:helicase-related protein n=1 Tax=Candidatus Poriferisocius sp. TaxID=3101276 RepID=UPI003B011F04
MEKPELAVNRHEHTVAGALNGFINHATTGFVGGAGVDIATAYFNVGGYSLLADALDGATGVRLLLGAEPTQPENRRRHLQVEPVQPERAERNRLRAALDGHEQNLRIERDHLGFTVEADASARRLVGWLRSGRVEVRRLEGRFLHGKAFLVGDRSHGVVAGSSNFTYAGLATNLELNLGNYSPHVVGQVQDWFDELWAEAEEYDLAALFEVRFEPHAPQLIYLRMLWELYAGEIRDEAEAEGHPNVHLTKFQDDGVWRARRILEEHHGVLIADEVGLGKTFLAGRLIEEAALERRQRVLVIAPATLRDGPWRAFRTEHNLPMELRSYEDMAGDRRLNPEHADACKLEAEINDYALVVIDEAHNLRNPATQRAEALRRLLADPHPKKLVMLTATPVNNSLWDLYHLLGYFLRNDATFADAGIRSLRDHFAQAMAYNPDDLTPEHLFDVLDAVVVRRTRSFVKRYYSSDTIRVEGKDTLVEFPTPRVRKVTYDIDEVMPGFFARFAHALDPQAGSEEVESGSGDVEPGSEDAESESDAESEDPGTLTLARYAPSQYRIDQEAEAYETQLAGLLRSGLLKRFESSPHAFAETCERMARSHDAFLTLLEQGRVVTGEVLADWIAADSDEFDSEQSDTHRGGVMGPTEDAGNYDRERLRAHVDRDRVLLREFAAEARKVSRADDPNLAVLVEELADIAAEAERQGIGEGNTRDRRKVLIFSYFTDTVEWIFEHLERVVDTDERLAAYRGRVACITGASRTASHEREKVLFGFAPRTTQAPGDFNDDLYDIVVTTDVLAEGVNLQQARHIINYDLPWNPMRLVQRHGRIDRIGSSHSEVFLRCVFPDSRLDDLLGLEERLHRKIAQAAASVGVGEVLPDQAARADINFTETREEIERIRNEDASLFERGSTSRGALSGEEFRQELRAAFEDSGLAERIESLPWGSGSGMVAGAPGCRPGYVFCARVGDHPKPQFRFVPTGTHADQDILSETLACLDAARPPEGFDTARRFDDATLAGAFAAWDEARADIVARWNHLADKANLEPTVAPRLHRVAEVLRQHPPPGINQEDIDRAIDTIRAPYPERTIRTLHAAITTIDDPKQQAQNILSVIKTLGLQPYEAPQPLPEIAPEDVNLVAWMALAG